ncbi:MAG: cyclase family protein [Acidimicrobiales bacterium]
MTSEATSRFVDLSHVIEDGMSTYPGLPGPAICDFISFEDSHSRYSPGTEFTIGRIDLVTNTGTYIDTPYHRYRDGHDLVGLDLATISNVPGLVVRVDAATTEIDVPHFESIDPAGRAVLVHTGWDRHWRTEQYFVGHPHLTADAASWLRDRGAVLVGIDSLNIDSIDGGERPVHSILLRAGIPIIEHMTNLGALPDSGFALSAVPPKISGLGTFPVRAHARVLEG